ncbi:MULTISPECIES: hypothetical protein [Mesorhizobium]|uniref:GlsB/YeaQ/YmgE family stress response membrane protein n=4 Tax=Mesorhizobium TaxID=68287 RepID=A0A1A5HR76_RHILI|nr:MULTISPECIES: hypothetical protein [Mesorhizobium]MBE1711770.1 hypothetical protein [Mesorhizobium japonicum]MBE1717678.1 hypothetical protein [Mesorhizobium japonicum]MUT23585.1 hypothetical protein [Mesorhizobium japonicum]OBP69458.1 hypothetical protein BAE39_24045 [Mesorhizobium loti]OBP84267.1 hypothetical protein BAE40_30230 [Mesorhizobium loti]
MVATMLLVVEFICGAASGIALGRWVPSFSLGRTANGLIGGIGGVLFVWPSARIPGVGPLVGHHAGGLTPTMLIGAGIAGLLGGLVLILLAGFVGALIRG